MRLYFVKSLLLGVLALVPVGCEPRPVVVDPGDGETTVIEDQDEVEVDRDAGTGVDVRVGGGEGVQVEVNGDAEDSTNQNP